MHRYGTRKSTQAAHPGVAAGLAKRSKDEIEAQAQAKRAVQAAQADKRVQEKDAAEQHPWG